MRLLLSVFEQYIGQECLIGESTVGKLRDILIVDDGADALQAAKIIHMLWYYARL
jgi:hypothetical protein